MARKMLPDLNNVILKLAQENTMMTSSKIQKDIVSACAQEIVKTIINDLDGEFFEILVNESKDISYHEQMVVASRYVNRKGKVNERVIAIVRVGDTLIKMSKERYGSSFKFRDQLRDHQTEMLEQLLESSEVKNGKGLNQERGLQRPGDTHWGSHFRTLDNFIVLFSSIAHVLDAIKCGSSNPNDRLQVRAFLTMINEFEFAFLLHLMLKILVMSNELSALLQRKEQDIINAIIFLGISKKRSQLLSDDEGDSLMNEVRVFCDKHEILIPKMDDFYLTKKLKCRFSSVTYSHHLCVELFYTIIDLQLQEPNNCFEVVSGNLLLGMTSLNPANAFANFDKEKNNDIGQELFG
ncbi:uncharacterized protein LOC107844514 [Capsicum annuum]|uniref:uncharacterized protein LOC107844514 n=1 Tax=Capsicum annuum TaxID=4072 RepID=UPI001FB050FD|nr:uncharacterized protein LOC107844514 [Capsicum annuum]